MLYDFANISIILSDWKHFIKKALFKFKYIRMWWFYESLFVSGNEIVGMYFFLLQISYLFYFVKLAQMFEDWH